MLDIRALASKLGQRRAFALGEPRRQVRLASTMLVITGIFLLLALFNGYSAFAAMLTRALDVAPEVWGDDLAAQAGLYLTVTAALAVLYAVAMIGASIAFVHQMAGPLTALQRHARSLRQGCYSSRIHLRGADPLYDDLAKQLNELAEALQERETHTKAA